MKLLKPIRVRAECGHGHQGEHWVTAEDYCAGGDTVLLVPVQANPAKPSAHHQCYMIMKVTGTGIYCTNVDCLLELNELEEDCPRCGEEIPQLRPHV